MAVMVPSEFELASATESERLVFDKLKSSLSDEFVVFHGLDYLEPKKASEGEADFLILHPRKGMLVLECKGEGVTRDDQGKWWRARHGKRERLYKSPSEQVQRHSKDLASKFSGPVAKAFPIFRNKFPLVYGWALIFPMAGIEAVNPPPSLERDVVLDAHALSDLGYHVQKAMDFWGRRFDGQPPGMTDAQFKRFLSEIVSPPIGIVTGLGPMLAFEKQQMLRLTESQDRVVRRIKDNVRVRVPGGAGTGKTVLAVEVARSLAAAGKDVLLLCFNRNLADHLQSTVSSWEQEGTITATSFHRLCASAGHSLERPISPPPDPKEQADYWTNEAPLVLLEAIEAGKVGGWDAIIVDEGQDFATSWWDILLAGLREPNSGRVAIFYDPSQRIFDHGGDVPAYAIHALDENLRNTRAIADVLLQLVDIDMESHPRCPDGEEPVIYAQQTPSKTRRQLTDLLDTLLTKQHLSPRDIAILTPHSPRSSILEGATELGDHAIVHSPSRWNDGVLHTSISGFKGLEAEIVIMLSIDPTDERCSVNTRYVGASRARHRLYVFAKGDWLASRPLRGRG